MTFIENLITLPIGLVYAVLLSKTYDYAANPVVLDCDNTNLKNCYEVKKEIEKYDNTKKFFFMLIFGLVGLVIAIYLINKSPDYYLQALGIGFGGFILILYYTIGNLYLVKEFAQILILFGMLVALLTGAYYVYPRIK